jgi:hypothetical protein
MQNSSSHDLLPLPAATQVTPSANREEKPTVAAASKQAKNHGVDAHKRAENSHGEQNWVGVIVARAGRGEAPVSPLIFAPGEVLVTV